MASRTVENVGQYKDNINLEPSGLTECMNADRGCKWKGSLTALETHKLSCPKDRVLCKYLKLGCSDHIYNDDQERHERENMAVHLSLARKCIESLMDQVQMYGERLQEAEEKQLQTQHNLQSESSTDKAGHKLLTKGVTQNELQQKVNEIASELEDLRWQRSKMSYGGIIPMVIAVIAILIAVGVPNLNSMEDPYIERADPKSSGMDSLPPQPEDLQQIARLKSQIDELVQEHEAQLQKSELHGRELEELRLQVAAVNRYVDSLANIVSEVEHLRDQVFELKRLQNETTSVTLIRIKESLSSKIYSLQKQVTDLQDAQHEFMTEAKMALAELRQKLTELKDNKPSMPCHPHPPPHRHHHHPRHHPPLHHHPHPHRHPPPHCHPH